MNSKNICRELKSRIIQGLDDILAQRDSRELKPDGSYVTKGDLLCERIVIDFFKAEYPACIVVSEESFQGGFAYDPEKSYAIVDPIDGTENFTSGLREWGISVSIYSGGEHSESMLLLPEMGLELLTGQAIDRRQSRIVGLSSSLGPSHFQELKKGIEYRIMGCAVYNLYCVITGSFSEFENPKGANCWDISAGLNLALEHKLRVTIDGKDFNGEFLQPNKRYRFKVSAR